MRLSVNWSCGLRVMIGAGVVLFWFATVFAAMKSTAVGLIVCAAIVAVILVALLTREAILTLSLVIFFIVPFYYLPIPHLIGVIGPSALLLVIVAFRQFDSAALDIEMTPLRVYLAVACSTYLLLISSLFAYANPARTTLNAILIITLLVILPARLSDSAIARPALRLIMFLGCLVSIAAIIERAAALNPLAGLYAASSYNLTQKWGTYRVFTTLGHPLLNGTVFAMLIGLGFAMAVVHRSRIGFALAGLSGVAMLATASRSAIAGATAAITLTIVLTALRRASGAARVRALLAAFALGVGLLLILPSTSLGERSQTVEAQGSSSLRGQYISLVPSLVRMTDYLGAGVGGSGKVLQDYGGAVSAYPLESSLAQAIVSFGPVGFILMVSFALTFVVPAVVRGAVVGPVGLCAFWVSAAGWNLLDAYPYVMILPSLLLAVTVVEARSGLFDQGVPAAKDVRTRAKMRQQYDGRSRRRVRPVNAR